MKKIFLTALTLSCAFMTTGCKSPYHTIDGFAQGSTYHLVVRAVDTTGMRKQIDSLFNIIDRSASLYREGSLLNRLNDNGTDSLDSIIEYCIALSRRVSRESDGRFDITIKPVTEAWGFAGKEYAGEPNIDSLLQLVGYQKISVVDHRLIKSDPRIRLDLNSVAQGYTADLLARLMESRGAGDYMVEIGGEVFARGVNPKGKPWNIGIDVPREGNYLPGNDLQVVLTLSDQGLATSGNYRKFFTTPEGRKIVHTIDALTGQSVISNLLSATVIAATAAEADIYGTMMMVIGLEESKKFLERHPEIKAYLVYTDADGNFLTWNSPSMQEHIINVN